MTAAPDLQMSGTDVDLDPEGVVERFPGPAAIVDARRLPVGVNALWRAAGLAAPGDGRHLPPELAASLLALSHTGRPQLTTMAIAGDEGSLTTYETTALPCAVGQQTGALVLARDRSMVQLVQDVLAQSREFHRGLVHCSSDIAFELDQAGRFTYVGPTGFLGFTADELLGQEMRELVCEHCRNAGEFALTSRESIANVELWFTAQSGEEQCFILSLMPYFNSSGAWAGIRGAGREVTGQRTLEAEVRRVRAAQKRVESVLYAMRCEARPSAMIAAGVGALMEAVDADICVAALAGRTGFDRICALVEADSAGINSVCGPEGEARLLDLCNHVCRQTDAALRIGALDNLSAIFAPTSYGGEINGVLGCVRFAAASAEAMWSEEDRLLVRSIASQMSVAIAQLDLFERPGTEPALP